MGQGSTVFTIGHSSHPQRRFEELLRHAGITAIADVRSAPFSRMNPQFNQDALKASLKKIGIEYSFLGRELGGRPAGPQFFCDGVADYDRMAERPEFEEGLQRVIKGARRYRVALLCSEHDPLDCHRCLLVGRQLLLKGVNVEHVLADGTILNQGAIEERLLAPIRRAQNDLFLSRDELLSLAYRERSRSVAFQEPKQAS